MTEPPPKKRLSATRLNLWVQTATSLAVVGGLALVIWDLNQAHTIAQSQLTSDAFMSSMDNRNAMLGEDAASAVAKACLDPAALDSGEITTLHNFYTNRVNLLRRRQAMSELQGETTIFPEAALSEVFTSAYGRAWWNAGFARLNEDPRLAALGDRVIEQLGPPDCRRFYATMTAIGQQVVEAERVAAQALEQP